ncbi:hypothetical protein [Prevotella intermedia]|uniref:DUF304 domain-containing protein n=1 Tax=Prevotella intermedia TaxID=28131 RepID=A0A2D3L8X5_PREIN|nr:hypothetical protein [Prevotella intermedia]ATV27032.1 hypothetical protein CTM62_09415 [Prevotella intermedia]
MDISVRPDYREFLAQNTGLNFLFAASIITMPLLSSFGNQYILIGVSATSLFLGILLVFRYIMITSVVWIIGEGTLCRICGILSSQTDYIELYRVMDYKETQTLLQKFWKVKTITIISTDKTDSTVETCGIKSDMPLIELIRDRVEKCKQMKRNYEITNY